MGDVEKSAERLQDYLLSIGFNATIGVVLSSNKLDKDELIAYIIGKKSLREIPVSWDGYKVVVKRVEKILTINKG